jgi:hypothetical protein
VAGPGSPDEYYIWTALVPRLIHPVKLTLIKALIQAGGPQSADDLVSLSKLNGDPREIERHATDMVDAGALEVASIQIKAADEVPLYSFPRQEQ